jgi:lysophospholipase L1-like esterase
MKVVTGKGSASGLVRIVAASLYLLSVTAATAGILEYVARLRTSFGYVRSASPREVYELRPGRADHNELGQRDRVYSQAKPPGTFRVAGIGDSNMYGMGAPRERVFLKQAEQLLARSANRPVEVINFGVPGYNTAQEANLLEDVVAAWDPDLVVLQFCANDFELPNFIQTSGGPLVTRSFALHVVLAQLAKLWPDFVKRKLMGYHYGRDVFRVPGLEHAPLDGPETVYERAGKTYTTQQFVEDPAKAPPEYRYMLGVDGVRAALRRVAAWSRAHRVPVIFLVVWSGKDRDAAALGAAEGLEVLDVWPAVTRYLEETGKQFTDLWVAPPTDSHPNEAGHAVIGQALAEAIAPHLAAAAR